MATKLYAVSALRNDNGNILALGLWNGRNGAVAHLIDRSEIIERMKPPNAVWDIWTAYQDDAGTWREGAQVHVFKNRFLRTDRNNIEDDNLDDLPDWEDGGFSLPHQV